MKNRKIKEKSPNFDISEYISKFMVFQLKKHITKLKEERLFFRLLYLT